MRQAKTDWPALYDVDVLNNNKVCFLSKGNQESKPVLNTICVFEITQETMDLGIFFACSHDEPLPHKP